MTTPIRILELRCADGGGGGPEKTILFGAAQSDPRRFAVSVCYIRSVCDDAFDIDRRASELGLDFTAIAQRHRLDPRIWLQARALVREKRIDIVHAHDYKTDLLGLLAARRVGVPVFAVCRGWTGEWCRVRHYESLDRRVLRCMDKVICVSAPRAAND